MPGSPLAALYDLIRKSQKAHVAYTTSDEKIELIRKLPSLLYKIGQGHKGNLWEPHFVRHYTKSENPFMKSLMAFLIPWDTCTKRSDVTISEEGAKMLGYPFFAHGASLSVTNYGLSMELCSDSRVKDWHKRKTKKYPGKREPGRGKWKH